MLLRLQTPGMDCHIVVEDVPTTPPPARQAAQREVRVFGIVASAVIAQKGVADELGRHAREAAIVIFTPFPCTSASTLALPEAKRLPTAT